MMKLLVLCFALIVIAQQEVSGAITVPEDSEIGKLLKVSVTEGLTKLYRTPYKLIKIKEMKSEQTLLGLKFNMVMDFEIGTSETKVSVSFVFDYRIGFIVLFVLPFCETQTKHRNRASV
jgi:hypothetical protein